MRHLQRFERTLMTKLLTAAVFIFAAITSQAGTKDVVGGDPIGSTRELVISEIQDVKRSVRSILESFDDEPLQPLVNVNDAALVAVHVKMGGRPLRDQLDLRGQPHLF